VNDCNGRARHDDRGPPTSPEALLISLPVRLTGTELPHTHCRANLAGYKMHPEVALGDLPIGPTGKIRNSALARRAPRDPIVTSPATDAPRSPAPTAPLAGVALALVWLGVMAAAITGERLPADFAVLALGAYLTLRLPHLSAESLFHLSLAGGVVALTLWQGEPLLVWQGLARAAQVAALFSGLSLLRFAAAGSRTMQQAGAFMAAQPPGRRYAAMSGGSHAVGLVLNYGVVTLLGPMIGGLRGPGADSLREGLALAVMRGFSTTFLWSPLTLSFGIVTSVVAGIDPLAMMATGAGCAAMILALGWALDRRRPRERNEGGESPPTAPGPVLWRLLGIILSLMAVVVTLHLALDVPLIVGVILGAPLYAGGWLWLLEGSPGRGARALGEAVAQEAAMDGRTVAVLGAAALMGTLIGGLVPDEAVRAVLTGGWLPAALVPAVLMAVVFVLGTAGANPLLSVMLLIGVIPDPAAFGILPEALGLALIAAWGLSLGVSRGGAALIALSQAICSTPGRLGLRGNLAFTSAAMALMAVVVTLMTALTPPP
jgi:hypothetical protein